MEYSKLIRYLFLIAIIASASEKMVSYIGQKTFPLMIVEGNPITKIWINTYGLEFGHLMAFIISVITASILKKLALTTFKILKENATLQAISRGIFIAIFVFLIIDTTRIFANNLHLLLAHI